MTNIHRMDPVFQRDSAPAGRHRRTRWSVVADVVTLVFGVLWLIPLVFAVLVAFRPLAEPLNTGNVFFGSRITLENFETAWNTAPWVWHFITSVIAVVGVLVVQLVTITLAGYAFARLKFPGRGLLLFVILLQLMIPTGVLIVQNVETMRDIGAFNTRWALMMPYWGSALGVLLMRQTFREIPRDLEEAARIDGANLFQVMTRIYIPLSIPTYTAFSLVSISARWNELLWPLVVTRNPPEARPLTVGLNQLFSATEAGAQWGNLMAGTLIVVLPLVLLFMLFQRQFIESFAASGLK